MNKDITLVILAAGMGSRFGGLKQIAPMGPNDEFLIDYSIYDAIKAGFNKVVFLIKEENFDIFKETIGSRVEPHIKVEYAFQKNDNLPDGYDEIKDRVKPLGTAHAILCCKDKVNEPFMMINADDFYGRDAYLKGAEFLRNIDVNADVHEYGMIGYKVKNTITENGAVKRGVCQVDNNRLVKLVESSVERDKESNRIFATPLDTSLDKFEVFDDTTVSMNMLLFDQSIFKYVEDHFEEALSKAKADDNLEKFEYLIPDVLFKSIDEGFSTCEVIPTEAEWIGVTYKEDTEGVREKIKGLVEKNIYPNNLWEE